MGASPRVRLPAQRFLRQESSWAGRREGHDGRLCAAPPRGAVDPAALPSGFVRGHGSRAAGEGGRPRHQRALRPGRAGAQGPSRPSPFNLWGEPGAGAHSNCSPLVSTLPRTISRRVLDGPTRDVVVFFYRPGVPSAKNSIPMAMWSFFSALRC